MSPREHPVWLRSVLGFITLVSVGLGLTGNTWKLGGTILLISIPLYICWEAYPRFNAHRKVRPKLAWLIVFIYAVVWIVAGVWVKLVLYPTQQAVHEDFRNTVSLDFQAWPNYKPANEMVGTMPWNESYVYTTIDFRNATDSDLSNVNMTLETDATFARIKETTILGAKFIPIQTVIGPVGLTIRDQNGQEHKQVILPGGDETNNGRYVTNTYKVYLDRLSSKEILQILIAGMSIGKQFKIDSHGALEGQPAIVRYVRLTGSFEAAISPGKADKEVHQFDVERGQRPADWQKFEFKF